MKNNQKLSVFVTKATKGSMWLLILSILTVMVVGISLFSLVMYEKSTSPFVIYWEDKFIQPQRQFMRDAFSVIPQASQNQTALMLAADVSDKDTVLPLEKGYRLIALDSQSINFELIIPGHEKYSDKIKVLRESDKEWNYETLPQVDILMASFVFPFYKPSTFPESWQEISGKLKVGGYFTGNFFSPQWDLVPAEMREKMTFHTKEEVRMLFKDYKILKLEEVRDRPSKGEGHDYYWEVFAKKIR